MAAASGDEPRVVLPQPITEKTYFENVVGFFNTVVPKAIAPAKGRGQTVVPSRQVVLWTRFDQSGLAGDGRSQSNILLVGYSDGLQAWDIGDGTAMKEVYSDRSGQVACAKILAAPETNDTFHGVRPILAYSEAATPSTVKLLSLATLEAVPKTIKAKASPVVRIESSEHATCVVTKSYIEVFDSGSLQPITCIQDCFNSPDPVLNPTALAFRWLAYASSQGVSGVGCGGINPDITGPVSSMAAVVGMAQKTGTNLMYLGGKGVKKVSDMISGTRTVSQGAAGNGHAEAVTANQAKIAGTIKIIDVNNPSRKVAHFRAHRRTPVAAMQFNSSGTVLITADTEGQDFHVYSMSYDGYDKELRVPKASGKAPPKTRQIPQWFLSARHLYTLHRGVTTATIADICFSADSRWVSVTSERGTSHIFPINPRGGPIDARTHTALTVTNVSRFHTSAGITDMPQWGGNGTIIVFGPKAMLKHPVSESGAPSRRPSTGAKGSPAGRVFHATTATCFGSLVASPVTYSGSAGADLARPKALLTFLVCTSGGHLVEHKLQPYGPPHDGTDLAQRLASSEGGMALAHQSSLASGVIRSVGSVLEGVKGMVQGAPAKTPSPDSEPPSPSLLVGSEMGLAGAAIRMWDLCRHKRWQQRNHASKGVRGQRRKPPRNRQRQDPGAAGWAPSGEDGNAWLSHVEMNCYNAPHRRLWMGPQFTFKTYQLREPMSGSQLGDSYLHDDGLHTESLAEGASRPISIGARDVEVVDVEVAGSPWPDAPTVEKLGDISVPDELHSAMRDTWGESDSEGSESRRSRHESEGSDLMFQLDAELGGFEEPSDPLEGSRTPTGLASPPRGSRRDLRISAHDISAELAGAMFEDEEEADEDEEDGRASEDIPPVDAILVEPGVEGDRSASASSWDSAASFSSPFVTRRQMDARLGSESAASRSRSSSEASEQRSGSASTSSSNSNSSNALRSKPRHVPSAGAASRQTSSSSADRLEDFSAFDAGGPSSWPSSARAIPQGRGRNTTASFHMGTPPTDDAAEMMMAGTPPSGLRRPINGLNAVLNDAEQEDPVHRVHSSVSLAALSDALSDAEEPFRPPQRPSHSKKD